MAKGQFAHDTFEKLTELGASTAKKTVKSVASTVSPTKIIEQIAGQKAEAEAETKRKELKKNGDSHTPVDLEGLKKKYDEQDKQKEVEIRNKLFQLVQEGSKSAKQKAEEKERQRIQEMTQETEEKKQKQKQKLEQEQQEDIPRGKERKSLFSTKKKSMEKHAEYKPAVGKQ